MSWAHERKRKIKRGKGTGEDRGLMDFEWKMVNKVQMVWFEWWSCLQDGRCCLLTWGSCMCTLYFRREQGMPS